MRWLIWGEGGRVRLYILWRGVLADLGGGAASAGQAARFGFAGQLNEPPQGGTDALERISGKAAKIYIPDLLENDTDFEGNSFSFAGASAASANGAEIIVDGNWLIYSSIDGPAGIDQVRYFLVDEFGGVSSGQIIVTPAGSETGPLLTLLRIEVYNNGALKRIGFVGIAGRTYQIQASEQLENPIWETIGTATAEENGVYWFDDAEALPARYYRSVAF